MSSLLEKALRKIEETTNIQLEEEEQKDSKPIEIKDLKPPKPPKPMKKESVQEIGEFTIDWLKVAQSSDFKRAVYLALEGKVWRGTNENLDKELNKKIQVFRDPNLSNVIKELEEHFKNGFTKPSQMN